MRTSRRTFQYCLFALDEDVNLLLMYPRIAVPVVLLAALAAAQDASRLMQDPAVKTALDAVKKNESHFIDEQIRICEIPAPPFHEEARGKELERLFKGLGLENVHIDKAGNLIIEL